MLDIRLACRVSPLPAVLTCAVTSLPPTAHSGAITSYCNRREGKPKLSASWVGLRLHFAFHQLRTADEGRIQIARRMPKRSSRVRPAGPSRPSEIIAQGSGIIRIVLAQAGTRRGGACGRDSKCAHSLNMCARHNCKRTPHATAPCGDCDRTGKFCVNFAAHAALAGLVCVLLIYLHSAART